jgi:hypothetical protein
LVQVFGFCWREQKEKAHQVFATVPEILLGKVRKNLDGGIKVRKMSDEAMSSFRKASRSRTP